jgi:hypothetical protein
MDATSNLLIKLPSGNVCHSTTRGSLLHAIVKLEVAASHLDRAFEADGGGLQPPLAILSAEARTVADRARKILGAAT